MRLRPLSLLLAPLWLLVALSLLVACVPGAGSSSAAGVGTAAVATALPVTTRVSGGIAGTPQPATALPTLPGALPLSELKYRVLAQYPDFFFCDPDYYPVARADEGEAARQHFPELQSNQEEFQAILAHNGLSGQAAFDDAQQLLIYREHKKLAALHFEAAGDKYQFQLTSGGEGKQSFQVQGLISGDGQINVQQQAPAFATCPICLAAQTRIDTPRGEVPVEDLRLGDSVWTLSAAGQRVAAPIVKNVRVPVAAGHVMLHVVLQDGRALWASPGHPTAQGQPLVDVGAGDMLDGARVILIERVTYDGTATYDILPAGITGVYWADGILMGSTLHQ